MTKKSRLHLPRVPARPGEKPDFSYVQLSPAGAVPRPQVNTRARDMMPLSVELVRVLDDNGDAVGPWHPHLDASDLQVGLRHMLLTRTYDDRMQRMQRGGKISFYIRSLGEEAVSVAQGMARPTRLLLPATEYRKRSCRRVACAAYDHRRCASAACAAGPPASRSRQDADARDRRRRRCHRARAPTRPTRASCLGRAY